MSWAIVVERMPDAGLQFVRRGGGERTTNHPIARVLPRFAGGVEAERLAGAGSGDEHVDCLTRCAHVPDHGGLFVADRRPRLDRTLDVRLDRHPSASKESARGEVDDRTLESDYLGG